MKKLVLLLLLVLVAYISAQASESALWATGYEETADALEFQPDESAHQESMIDALQGLDKAVESGHVDNHELISGLESLLGASEQTAVQSTETESVEASATLESNNENQQETSATEWSHTNDMVSDLQSLVSMQEDASVESVSAPQEEQVESTEPAVVETNDAEVLEKAAASTYDSVDPAVEASAATEVAAVVEFAAPEQQEEAVVEEVAPTSTFDAAEDDAQTESAATESFEELMAAAPAAAPVAAEGTEFATNSRFIMGIPVSWLTLSAVAAVFVILIAHMLFIAVMIGIIVHYLKKSNQQSLTKYTPKEKTFGGSYARYTTENLVTKSSDMQPVAGP